MGYLSIFLIVIVSVRLNVVQYYKNKELKKKIEDQNEELRRYRVIS